MINTTDVITRLENLISEKIPVTRHLHFHIHVDDYGLPVLEVPLQPNVNHLGTAFGGSLSMLCTIEGWCCMYLLLENFSLKADILIQKSKILFHSPVENDFNVTCKLTDQSRLHTFVQTFRRFGKSRIPITCYVQENNQSLVAAEFQGVYAAIAPKI